MPLEPGREAVEVKPTIRAEDAEFVGPTAAFWTTPDPDGRWATLRAFYGPNLAEWAERMRKFREEHPSFGFYWDIEPDGRDKITVFRGDVQAYSHYGFRDAQRNLRRKLERRTHGAA